MNLRQAARPGCVVVNATGVARATSSAATGDGCVVVPRELVRDVIVIAKGILIDDAHKRASCTTGLVSRLTRPSTPRRWRLSTPISSTAQSTHRLSEAVWRSE